MTLFALVLVSVAAVTHAGWNLIGKSTRPAPAFFMIANTVGVVCLLPGFILYGHMLLEELRGTAAEQHVNWDTVDWLRPFGGIRIEDNVRVMAGGRENLTRDAFARAS